MSLIVTQRPSTTISGNTSRWNAAKNPIVYKMIRKDYTWTVVNNNAGRIEVLHSGPSTPFTVGKKFWLVSGNGLYNQQVTVNSTVGSSPTTIIFNETYLGSGGSDIWYNDITSRTNYRVRVGVYNTANSLLSTLSYSPDKSGNLIIDVATPLLNNLSVDNVADYVTGFTTNDETSAYVRFYIRYTEVWTGSAESETNDTANQFFALYGARQIGELYGGNMAEYVTYENATPLSLFPTKFKELSYWTGWPFSIHAIMSDNRSTTSGFLISSFDANNTPILDDYTSTALISAGGKLIRIKPFPNFTLPTNAAYFFIRLTKPGISFLSENKRVNIKEPCANPIMLWWRNSLGGDAFWMFEVNQSYSYRYDNERKAKRYVLFASNLRLDEFDGINELNTLGEVYEPAITELTTSVNKSQARIGSQVYMMDATGKKTGVIVIPTEVSTKTKFSKHKIQITIELPEIY